MAKIEGFKNSKNCSKDQIEVFVKKIKIETKVSF